MEPFTDLTAVAAPLIRANVDTDAIIPSREMKSVSKSGLADGLFAGWRYREIGGRDPDPAFVLNRPEYAGARILLGGENFGCGSSREHAVWALVEFGIRAIVAPSFSPIFYGKCVRNGLLPIRLPAEVIATLAADVAEPKTGKVPCCMPIRPSVFIAMMRARSASQHSFVPFSPETMRVHSRPWTVRLP